MLLTASSLAQVSFMLGMWTDNSVACSDHSSALLEDGSFAGKAMERICGAYKLDKQKLDRMRRGA
jgi:hypothetical protein